MMKWKEKYPRVVGGLLLAQRMAVVGVAEECHVVPSAIGMCCLDNAEGGVSD